MGEKHVIEYKRQWDDEWLIKADVTKNVIDNVIDTISRELTERQRIIIGLLPFDDTGNVTETTSSLAQKTGVYQKDYCPRYGCTERKGLCSSYRPRQRRLVEKTEITINIITKCLISKTIITF